MTGRGARAALGRRQRVMPLVRKAAYVGLSRRSAAGGLLSGRPADRQPPPPAADYLMLRPGVRSSSELSDLAARVNWYLPDARVPVAVDRAPGTEIAPEHVGWMEPELVREPAWLDGAPGGRPHDVIHRVRPQETATVLRRGRACVIAAHDFYYVADLGWMWLRWHFATMPSRSSDVALERLFSLGGAGATSFVLATGPSARLVDPSAVSAEVRISCNSVVRDLDLLRALRPNVICFMDPVFHYGPSRYAAAFRRDLLRAADETDALLVTFELWAGLLLAHHPELADRLVILRMLKGGPAWRWPDRERMAVRMTGNVLTNAMLPIAFALTDRVQIAGCDGRGAGERYFWRHNAATQYSDELMASAFDAHPAFFRDRDYADYYEDHCQDLEELLTAGEAAGKRSVAVTPSHIPALHRRGARALGT
jgi:hypothetical protein